MPSDATNEATRREWRELGFFYDRNDQQKLWELIGSRSGLMRFRDALSEYAEDPNNDYESEHKHYGPYLYLEIMTWPEPGFDDHAIRGSLPDLKRLAAIERLMRGLHPVRAKRAGGKGQRHPNHRRDRGNAEQPLKGALPIES